MKHGPVVAILGLVVITAVYVSSYFGVSFISSSATETVSRIEHLEGWRSYDELIAEGVLLPQEAIMEFQFLPQPNLLPQLAVERITKKNGYVPRLALSGAMYRIQILDTKKTVLYEQRFTPPIGVLPWFSDGMYFKLIDPTGKALLLQPLARIPYENHQPMFHMIRADAFFALPGSPLPIDKDGPRFDIVFVPQGYGDKTSEFHSDVERIAQYVAETEPFFSDAKHTYFSYIDVPADGIAPLSAVQSAGAPADEIIVLTKGVPLEEAAREFLSRR